MYTLHVENAYGERLELTHNESYSIVDIAGIDPPDANINATRNAGEDGAVYNSAYIQPRTITLTLAINGPAEANRIELYRYFKSKFPVTIYYSNGARSVYINGYTQTVQIAFFNRKQTAVINVYCPRPLFNGTDEDIQQFSAIIPLFEFPFSIAAAGIPFSEIRLDTEHTIINNGDIETGTLIRIHALGPVVNPKIYNTRTNERIFLNRTMSQGEDIIINTRRGEKACTLISGGTSTNIINSFAAGSSWLQLAPGDNVFAIAADSGLTDMVCEFTTIDQYEGV